MNLQRSETLNLSAIQGRQGNVARLCIRSLRAEKYTFGTLATFIIIG